MKGLTKVTQAGKPLDSTGSLARLKEALAMSPAAFEKKLARRRREVLLQLANSPDERLHAFRKHSEAGFYIESDKLLVNARRDLRQIWQPDTSRNDKQTVVDAWLAAATKDLFKTPILAPLVLDGRLTFDPANFRMQFVLAILENWRRFGICQNPDCAVPYYFKTRKTQKFCERGECTRWAQVQYSTDSRARKHARIN
jgi:hypothetical protein